MRPLTSDGMGGGPEALDRGHDRSRITTTRTTTRQGSEPHRGLPRTRRRMHGCALVSNSQARNLILTRVAVCWKDDSCQAPRRELLGDCVDREERTGVSGGIGSQLSVALGSRI